MKAKVKAPITPEHYLVPNELTIYTAQEVRENLLKLFKKGTGVELDFSNVAEIDTAEIQLLMSLKKMVEPVHIKNPSQALKRIATILTIDQQLPDILN